MADIENKLKDFLKEIAQGNNYAGENIDIQAVSSGGANYNSDLYLISVSAPQKQDLKLFAKVANIGESVRAENEGMTLIYQTECIFYTELAISFNKLYNEREVPEKNRLYITKFYGYKGGNYKETLVLENLVTKDFGNFNRMKTVNWDYASKAVEELAKFHALGLAYREESRSEYEQIVKQIRSDLFPNEKMAEMFIEEAIRMGNGFVKHEYKEKIQKYLDKSVLYKDMVKLAKKVDGGFLIHGDYRPSNLMHRRRNGKLEVVILDYQTLRTGRLVTDLIYFIWTSSDSQFRKLFYRSLLDHYYAALAQSLRDLRLDAQTLYPREQFDKELEEAKTLGLLLGLTMMSVLTVDPEDVPKSLDNNFTIQPNRLALERMNDIVGDYVTRGVI